jgi:hypothetical protein
MARVPPPEKQTPVLGKLRLASGNSCGVSALLHAKIVALDLQFVNRNTEKMHSITN